MDAGSVFILGLVYLFLGCTTTALATDFDYPILSTLFWPAVFVIKLVMEIIELIGDIRDGTLW